MIRFLRHTHFKNGKIRKVIETQSAKEVWDNTVAGFVGHMLSFDKPMSFKDLVRVVHAYNEDYNELHMAENEIAHGLVLLLENDLVKICEE